MIDFHDKTSDLHFDDVGVELENKGDSLKTHTRKNTLKKQKREPPILDTDTESSISSSDSDSKDTVTIDSSVSSEINQDLQRHMSKTHRPSKDTNILGNSQIYTPNIRIKSKSKSGFIHSKVSLNNIAIHRV